MFLKREEFCSAYGLMQDDTLFLTSNLFLDRKEGAKKNSHTIFVVWECCCELAKMSVELVLKRKFGSGSPFLAAAPISKRHLIQMMMLGTSFKKTALVDAVADSYIDSTSFRCAVLKCPFQV